VDLKGGVQNRRGGEQVESRAHNEIL